MDIRIFVPIMVFAVGLYFMIRLGGVLFKTRRREGAGYRFSVGGFSSLMLALAGTLGVGNVFGVATALIIGGAGSVFWLLFSALFSSVIKYAEAALAISYGKSGGMIFCFRESFGGAGALISKLYSLGALALGVVMGFALQGGSVCEFAYVSFGTPSAVSAAIMVLVLLIIVSNKGQKIKKFTAVIIPLTTIIYIFIALGVIISNSHRLALAIKLIFSDAFGIDSGVGGVLGFICSRSVREGYCGGILSNEAGAGTSSFAHTSDKDATAVGGVAEVFFDTVILCMLTALAILVSVPNFDSFKSGAELVASAVYSVFGGGGLGALSFVSASFAVCTSACWYYYCSECLRELFGRGGGKLLGALMALSVFIGAHIGGVYLVVSSHYLLLFLSVLSLAALVKNSDRVVNFTLSERKVITKGEFSNSKRRPRNKGGKERKRCRIRSFLRLRS